MHLVPILTLEESVLWLGTNQENLLDSLMEILTDTISATGKDYLLLESVLKDASRTFCKKHPSLTLRHRCLEANDPILSCLDFSESELLEIGKSTERLITVFYVGTVKTVSEWYVSNRSASLH